MRIKSICVSILALVCMAPAIAMYGQEIRSMIVGNVTDSSGAAVPGARITVKNEGTGIEYTPLRILQEHTQFLTFWRERTQ